MIRNVDLSLAIGWATLGPSGRQSRHAICTKLPQSSSAGVARPDAGQSSRLGLTARPAGPAKQAEGRAGNANQLAWLAGPVKRPKKPWPGRAGWDLAKQGWGGTTVPNNHQPCLLWRLLGLFYDHSPSEPPESTKKLISWVIFWRTVQAGVGKMR